MTANTYLQTLFSVFLLAVIYCINAFESTAILCVSLNPLNSAELINCTSTPIRILSNLLTGSSDQWLINSHRRRRNTINSYYFLRLSYWQNKKTSDPAIDKNTTETQSKNYWKWLFEIASCGENRSSLGTGVVCKSSHTHKMMNPHSGFFCCLRNISKHINAGYAELCSISFSPSTKRR